jgi:SAM-dependent methyltransferase
LLPRPALAAARALWLWTNPFRYELGILHVAIGEAAKRVAPRSEARILDYGCGGRPYRGHFPESCTYVGADIVDNPAAELVIRDDGTVPAPDSSFDLVVSTQVLEHLPDPAVYLRECHRLLKPAGKLLLTTHGLMFYHPYPQDLWRWTADGLSLIAKRAGLRVVSVDGVMGLIPTSIWLMMFNYQDRLPWGVRHLYVLLCNLTMLATDRLTSRESRLKNANVYVIIAERPELARAEQSPGEQAPSVVGKFT